MSKFNSKSTGTKTTNLVGGEAFKVNSKFEFISILLTSFVQSQFYRSENKVIENLRNLFNLIPDKLFLAKTAIYARTKFGMRSVSHIVAGEIAKSVKNEEWSKSFFDKIVYRVDDMSEILSYYIDTYGKPIPNSLKKGFANAFNKFNEYKLAKYKGTGNKVSLIDVINIVHPKENKTNKEALKKLMTGKLVSFDTWENDLTQAEQAATNETEKSGLKKQVWIKLIKEKKIGYFALLRNLRNIIEQAPEIIPDACDMLIDEKLIKGSLVLPFRYATALKELEQMNGSRKIITAISKALDISLNSVPVFKGKTLIVLDESGSMQGKPIEIGSLFAAVLYKSNDADLVTFANSARYRTLNPLDTTLSIANFLKKDFIGAGTDFSSIFPILKTAYDRIIILSDMQGWVGYYAPVNAFNNYKKRTGANPYIYSFDLQGYGTAQFPENNIFCLTGFSDKIFDIMTLLETDKNALIKEIESIKL